MLEEWLARRPGSERWAVKCAADPETKQVDWWPYPSSIASLTALARPKRIGKGTTRRPEECRVYRVSAHLMGARLEQDGDYHLVLSDLNGHFLVAEVPDPAFLPATCAQREAITKARWVFARRFPQIKDARPIPLPSLPVTVSGLGFFDLLHGVDYAAPNGIELHPVLDLAFHDEEPA